MSTVETAGTCTAILDELERAVVGRRRTLEHFTPTAAAARLQAQLLERQSISRPVLAQKAAAPALEGHEGQEL